ncbi:hypothetical protein Pint_36336 [Pistacia integerrima]|uniref:Uncharacterized protein n=1 Tax=Pistacia integerrima TaxID=434235 RepID=A0ACC0Y126_9ROSI|nr:hypothetical protein Pint_36336 [Pistacia integerrima]
MFVSLDGSLHLFRKNLFPCLWIGKRLSNAARPETRFSSQLCSQISHLKCQLQTLTQASKPVDNQDLISFLLGGLQSSYTPFVTSFNFASRETDFTFKDFQAKLLGYENLMDINHFVPGTDSTHFAFAANKSKAPTYVKKKGPPLPPTKMHNAASSNYRPHQQTTLTAPQQPSGLSNLW